MSDKRNFNSLNDCGDDVDLQVNGMIQGFWKSQSESQEKENEQIVENNNDTNQRSKRSRKQPNRYGSTEEDENDDLLMDEIDAQSNSNEVSVALVTTEKSSTQQNDCIEPAILSQLTPGEQILLKKLIEVSTDVKVLQKTVVQLELRQGQHEVETHSLNSADSAVLLELGLPLANEDDINNFNNKLKTKTFWSMVVGIFVKDIKTDMSKNKKKHLFIFLVQCTKGCWRRIR